MEKWRSGNQAIPWEDLKPVLDYFFPELWSHGGGKGSHQIKIQHPELENEAGFTPGGRLNIPLRGGRKVIPVYLKLLLKAIDLIENKRGNK